MKKLIIFIIVSLAVIFLVPPVQAKSKTWVLYLHKDISTGITTAQNGGVSTMVVEGQGMPRNKGLTTIHGLDALEGSAWVVQVDDITVCDTQIQAALAGSSNYSGATFTLRYKESIIDNANHWDKAQTIDVFTGTALSGDSRLQTQIYPVGMGHMQWEFVTGTTAFGGATVYFIGYDDN